MVELGPAPVTPQPRQAPGNARPPSAWIDLLHVAPARAVIVLAECPDHCDPAALHRLRAGAHAVAGLDLPPHVMLQRMDEFAGECGVGFPVSMVIAVVDGVRATMRVACAGAPPPLLLLPDEVTPVAATVGPPVGLGAAYPEVEGQPVPQDVVIAFTTTPGLAAGPDSASQVRELAAILGGRADTALSEMVDDLLAATRRHPDTAPITLMRLEGDPAFAAHWVLPGGARSATRGRHLIDGVLADWPGSTPAMRHDVRLVATELLARVLAVSTGSVSLHLALTDDGILVEVNGGDGEPAQIRRPASPVEGDPGRTLIADLSTRCGPRWSTAPGAWAQVPWTLSPGPAPDPGAVGA